ncbi:MAG: hypothetical protein ACK50P_16700 [Planctomycetaceae bacterium]|jgi:hypothetical protein
MQGVTQDGSLGELAPETASPWGRRKRWLVAMLFVASALLGIAGCFIDEEDSVLELLLGLPLLVLSIAWCFADARERGHRLGRVMRLLLVLSFALALPIYLFQSRGWRGIITLLQVVGVMTAVILVGMAAEWLTLQLGARAGWWMLSESM